MARQLGEPPSLSLKGMKENEEITFKLLKVLVKQNLEGKQMYVAHIELLDGKRRSAVLPSLIVKNLEIDEKGECLYIGECIRIVKGCDKRSAAGRPYTLWEAFLEEKED